jgi:hypothetical protein
MSDVSQNKKSKEEVINTAVEMILSDPTVTQENLKEKCRDFVTRCVEQGKEGNK